MMQTRELIKISPPLDELLLKQSLGWLEEKMKLAMDAQRGTIENIHLTQKSSAYNLVCYLALRNEDIRPLQISLHNAGLSSLANSESHIHRQIQAIQQILGQQIFPDDLSDCDYYKGREIIRQRSLQLFGSKQDAAIPYIMVTMDRSFIGNFTLVRKLLEAGMNIARINSAHDDEKVWENMIAMIKRSSSLTGIPCKIFMDLAGPKIRTRILGKGRKKGKVPLAEGKEIIFAEQDADYDPSDVVIGCSEPGIINQLKTGEYVLFDDGLIETQVNSKFNGIAVLNVIRISGKKPQLKEKKGINFPDAEFDVPVLTKKDRHNIHFISQHADMLGFSFVRSASAIRELQTLIASLSQRPHIILKIETPQAVKHFPSLLLQGMQEEIFGVMIARGDLAVEIGFEQLSEIQEEILWFCEAAHVPVIWATQVLESLNKSGIATRAEVTDASHAAMAECVMVNKGDHVVRVIKSLQEILKRSGVHHIKKRYALPPVQMAADFFNEVV